MRHLAPAQQAGSPATDGPVVRATLWVVMLVAATGMSAIAGRMGAWFVWNFIYGIGSSVVTDELYAQLESPVTEWGTAVGAAFGFLIAIGCRHGAPIALVASHILATFAGVIGGGSGWKFGLVGYFGCLALCLACAWTLAATGYRRVLRSW